MQFASPVNLFLRMAAGGGHMNQLLIIRVIIRAAR